MLRILFLCYRSVAMNLWPGSCRFHPSCSENMEISLRKYGFLKGTYLGLKQFLNCHPWSFSAR